MSYFEQTFTEVFNLADGDATGTLSNEYDRFLDYAKSAIPDGVSLADGYESTFLFHLDDQSAREIVSGWLDGFFTTPYDEGGTSLVPSMRASDDDISQTDDLGRPDQGNLPSDGEVVWEVRGNMYDLADAVTPTPIPAEGSGAAVFEYMGLEIGDQISLWDLFFSENAIPTNVTSEELQEFKSLIQPDGSAVDLLAGSCLLYTSPSPRDQRGSRMPSSA